MNWNYRVIRKAHHGETSYGIHEVYYENDTITIWTQHPVEIYEDSLEDLKVTLEHIQVALSKPVIDANTGKEIKR